MRQLKGHLINPDKGHLNIPDKGHLNIPDKGHLINPDKGHLISSVKLHLAGRGLKYFDLNQKKSQSWHLPPSPPFSY